MHLKKFAKAAFMAVAVTAAISSSAFAVGMDIDPFGSPFWQWALEAMGLVPDPWGAS